ncbi:wyosine base formation domain-containing protein [Pseudarthrobacter sulfonivorans]|uniref:Wyosine base formation domain-containing protein n=1 Tax=Pseudarthrobacter sulfonivorans TaxID=121292 RepID=A0A0U3PZU4_9MICC|nr:TIGR03084 family metal-binding protein [Pseudarthrobacter sulfonivorans]ALV39886.1 wyosine base formation domain-containing protein [Pseudarthrobacter sulfonivorans]
MPEVVRANGVLDELLTDLEQMGGELEEALNRLSPRDWNKPTPAAGWTIAHQIGHLAWTDRMSIMALTNHDEFDGAVTAALADPHGFVETGAAEGVADAGEGLMMRWRSGREVLAVALATASPNELVPWFGPPMKPTSMATARIMETFAHGLDITDTLELPPGGLGGLRHVCHLGVRTRDYSFRRQGLEAPTAEFRVELRGPDGQIWSWGPEDAEQKVLGSALEFSMLVTRRRHRDDLDLAFNGPDVNRWLDIAQTFAGPSGSGRRPTRF